MPLSPTIVLWGTSGHASVVADLVRAARSHRLVALIDDSGGPPPVAPLCDLPVLRTPAERARMLEEGNVRIVIAIGDCEARLRCAETAEREGFELATLIHPSAVVAEDCSIGAGTAIMANAVVNTASVVGRNSIVNTSSSVDHHCSLADGVHLSPGVHLAGGVRIGRASWIGIGTVVKEKVSIGDGVIVGAGSVVLRDLRDGVTAYGSPAKITTKRTNP